MCRLPAQYVAKECLHWLGANHSLVLMTVVTKPGMLHRALAEVPGSDDRMHDACVPMLRARCKPHMSMSPGPDFSYCTPLPVCCCTQSSARNFYMTPGPCTVHSLCNTPIWLAARLPAHGLGASISSAALVCVLQLVPRKLPAMMHMHAWHSGPPHERAQRDHYNHLTECQAGKTRRGLVAGQHGRGGSELLLSCTPPVTSGHAQQAARHPSCIKQCT
jgi:hypothetical protein